MALIDLKRDADIIQGCKYLVTIVDMVVHIILEDYHVIYIDKTHFTIIVRHYKVNAR